MSGKKWAALIAGSAVLVVVALGAGYLLGGYGGSDGHTAEQAAKVAGSATGPTVATAGAQQAAAGPAGAPQGQGSAASTGSPAQPQPTQSLPQATPTQHTVPPTPTQVPPTATAQPNGDDPTLVQLDPNLVVNIMASPTPDIQIVQLDPNLAVKLFNVPPTITSLDVHPCGQDVVITLTASEGVSAWITYEPLAPAGPAAEGFKAQQLQTVWSWSETLAPMTLYNIVVHVQDADGAETVSDPVTVMTTFAFMGC